MFGISALIFEDLPKDKAKKKFFDCYYSILPGPHNFDLKALDRKTDWSLEFQLEKLIKLKDEEFSFNLKQILDYLGLLTNTQSSFLISELLHSIYLSNQKIDEDERPRFFCTSVDKDVINVEKLSRNFFCNSLNSEWYLPIQEETKFQFKLKDHINLVPLSGDFTIEPLVYKSQKACDSCEKFIQILSHIFTETPIENFLTEEQSLEDLFMNQLILKDLAWISQCSPLYNCLQTHFSTNRHDSAIFQVLLDSIHTIQEEIVGVFSESRLSSINYLEIVTDLSKIKSDFLFLHSLCEELNLFSLEGPELTTADLFYYILKSEILSQVNQSVMESMKISKLVQKLLFVSWKLLVDEILRSSSASMTNNVEMEFPILSSMLPNFSRFNINFDLDSILDYDCQEMKITNLFSRAFIRDFLMYIFFRNFLWGLIFKLDIDIPGHNLERLFLFIPAIDEINEQTRTNIRQIEMEISNYLTFEQQENKTIDSVNQLEFDYDSWIKEKLIVKDVDSQGKNNSSLQIFQKKSINFHMKPQSDTNNKPILKSESFELPCEKTKFFLFDPIHSLWKTFLASIIQTFFKLKLPHYFKSLQEIFFLSNGFFSSNIVEILSLRIVHKKSFDYENVLSSALLDAIDHSDHLSHLNINLNQIKIIDKNDNFPSITISLAQDENWDVLNLTGIIGSFSKPLDSIFTNNIMQDYQMIMNQLVAMLTIMQSSSEFKALITDQYRKSLSHQKIKIILISKIHNEMAHVLRSICNYLCGEALKDERQVFFTGEQKDDFDGFRQIDEIFQSHREYLRCVKEKSFLSPQDEEINQCLKGIASNFLEFSYRCIDFINLDSDESDWQNINIYPGNFFKLAFFLKLRLQAIKMEKNRSLSRANFYEIISNIPNIK